MNSKREKQQSKKYRPLPFWSWNDKLNPEQLKEQIQWMKQNGIGGYFMHARSGLQTEYLSDEWMKCIEICSDEGDKYQMTSWVYDENGWPSGFVGGKLLKDEANCDKYILTQIGPFDETATVSYLIGEKDLIRTTTGDTGKEYLNLYIHTSVSTVDILNPKVVNQFLELTHEKYKEWFDDEFSDKIEGFFTDEPQYFRWHTPYTVMIEKYWKDHFDEDILDTLGLLFLEKKGYRKFRYRYWKTMQSLMLEGFAKLVYQWCDENGVKLTGHYIEETSMAYQMMCCGGVMPFYEYQHIPGIDWLGKGTSSSLSAKQVSSVAAQLGKKQVLTETFACCGWDVTLADLRRIAGFQYVNGVNLICHHLIPYSERGCRKYDYPAHYSDVNPWVKEEFRLFNDYFSQLGYLLGDGEKHVNVAMLHPIRSTYFDYKREELYVGELDNLLADACRLLSKRGVDYHFLDETLLAKYGFIKGNKIGCGECTYDYLVIPPILTMDQSTEVLLSQYVKQGGKVLMLGEAPKWLEAEPHVYDFLTSNVSLDEIVQAQPFTVSNYETEIYSTYRTMNGQDFLYVINASDSKSYVQRYDLGDHIKSFKRIDLIKNTEELVPLELCLDAGEDALLYPMTEVAPEKELLTPYNLRFKNATVHVKENYLPVDKVRYSYDGISYSELWPCAALFQKLLRERYEGRIYFRYDFEIESIPEKMFLRTEKSNELFGWMNGKLLEEKYGVEDQYINIYDITDYVVKGSNSYAVQVEWFQKEQVYSTLFGENVTESLKNCLVYDTELQAIELAGSFGVYPKSGYYPSEHKHFLRGNDFYIGNIPKTVTEPSAEGFPFLSGEMILCEHIYLESTNILLKIPGEYQMACVEVNDNYAGQLFFSKELDISKVAKPGENEIRVRFVLGNRNRFGPHHFNGDKDHGVGPIHFTMANTWQEKSSEEYHDDYDIKKIFMT